MAGAGSDELPVWLIALFPVFFIGLWLAICFLLGRMSGWTRLQELYPDRAEEPVLEKFVWQSASMGGAFGMPVNFNGCLTIEACAVGVRFRLWKIFGMFQRPFFVPWCDLAVAEKKLLFVRRARLLFVLWQGGEMLMPLRTWNRIARHASASGLELP